MSISVAFEIIEYSAIHVLVPHLCVMYLIAEAHCDDVVQNPLFEYVDVWAQNQAGEPIGVIVLYKLHMLELSSAIQGWMCAVCKELHRILPHLVVIMPARGYGNTPGVQEQIWAQLQRRSLHM